MEITAEQVAAELRWRLSNSNSEIGELDVAYNTWEERQDGATFLLSVSFSTPDRSVSGHRNFSVTVDIVAVTA